MVGNRRKLWFKHLIIYGLAFLLFWEWLRPVPFFTKTENFHVVILFGAFTFLLTYFRLSLFLSLPIKLIAILYGIHMLYFEGSFFSIDWLILFGIDIAMNAEMIFQGSWNALSDSFRSLLLFVLLGIVSYLIYYWLVQRGRSFVFFLLTVIYVTVIDTFSDYDATAAIIRVVVIGFILLGLMQLFRLQEQNTVGAFKGRFSFYWILALIFILVVSTFSGVISPKYDPQWTDPLLLVNAFVNGDEGAQEKPRQVIGYSSDASQLGGGFDFDDKVVFRAEAKRHHYWRGESMDHYTGKGWEVTTEGITGGEINLLRYTVPVERLEATIETDEEREFSHIFYPGQFILVEHNERNIYVANHLYTGKVRIFESGNPIALQNYTVEYNYPQFSISSLRESGDNDPSEIKEHFLQLPTHLPERVTQLARQITEEYDNRYDKVTAVEQFFMTNGFIYETSDVPWPGENQDYVDQFLFETRRGYCDNFSSSMAVLLRTIDIPTRWVRGFTPGEVVENLDDDVKVYEVRNDNAHSWVEVYFPNIGWVPFEPTIGYNDGIADIIEDDELEEEIIENEEDELEEESENEEKEDEVMTEEEEDEANAAVKDDRINSWLKIIPLALIGIAFIYFFIKFAIFIAKNRKRFFELLYFYRFQKRNDGSAFEEAYHSLLKLLQKRGIKRESGETLREYAYKVDSVLRSTDMIQLTAAYEKVCYGGQNSELVWNEMKPLWEKIIKKMSS